MEDQVLKNDLQNECEERMNQRFYTSNYDNVSISHMQDLLPH